MTTTRITDASLVWFGLVCWCLTALSAQIGYIEPYPSPKQYIFHTPNRRMKYILFRAGETHSNINKSNKTKEKNTRKNLFNLGSRGNPVTTKVSSEESSAMRHVL